VAGRDDQKAAWATAASVLGLNGLGEIVYREFIRCNYEDPILGCQSLAGGYGWPVGIASEGEIVGVFFVASLICGFIAWQHDW
jgi:hypothetical protein